MKPLAGCVKRGLSAKLLLDTIAHRQMVAWLVVQFDASGKVPR